MPTACLRCGASNDDRALSCLNCGAKIAAARPSGLNDPRLGAELLGRYRILWLIGEGGMGRIYLADQAMGMGTRRVAIKTLQVDLNADPTAITRFQHECKTVCDLDHPNTIKFYDFGRLDDGALFIAMEYIEGQSLADIVRGGPMPPRRVDGILVQLCGSLAEAHQKGIVHRDLKPDNVLLTNRAGQTDFVKVLDFGIAKRNDPGAQQGAQLTMQGMMLGTPPYMSPEQFRGEALDGRSDMYSLAVMVFEMLTGRLPFDAKTPWEWALKHMSEPPLSLDRLPATAALPAHRKAAVERALAKNRHERFADLHEFLRAFTGIQDMSSAWLMVTSGSSATPEHPALSHAPVAPVLLTPRPLLSATVVAPPPMFRAQEPAPPRQKHSSTRWLLLAIPAVAGVGIIVGLLAFGTFGQPTVGQTPPRPRSVPAPTPIQPTLVPTAPTAPTVPTVPVAPAQGTESPAPSTSLSQWLSIVHRRGSTTNVESALGRADSRYAQIPARTYVTLQTEPGWLFASDGTPAPDLEIYVDGTSSSPYQIEVGHGPGHDSFVSVVSYATGQASIDLDAMGVTETRLVRIRNLGNLPVYLDAAMAHRVVMGTAGHTH